MEGCGGARDSGCCAPPHAKPLLCRRDAWRLGGRRGGVQAALPQFGKALLLVDLAACVGKGNQKARAYEGVVLRAVGVDNVLVIQHAMRLRTGQVRRYISLKLAYGLRGADFLTDSAT